MKILKVEFENINSLAGKWSINFEDPKIAGEGIFLIHGDTGAGKTTILDAICLALYGETPRIKPTGSSEGVISRGTSGGAWAGVLFAGDDGRRYFSEWRQARKRPTKKNPEGSIDVPKLEKLRREEGGKLCATDLTAQDVLGLEFQQFTKTVILPQGEFSRFMKGNDAETAKHRAAILEKLTGTQIFCRIGQNIFRKHRQVNLALKALENEVGAIAVLSQEERSALEKQRQSAEEKIPPIQKVLAKWKTASDWFVREEEFAAKLSAAERLVQEVSGKDQAFEPQRARRAGDEAAAKLMPFITAKDEADRKLAEIRAGLNSESAKISELCGELERSKRGVLTAEEARQKTEQKRNARRLEIDDARAKDGEIAQAEVSAREKREVLQGRKAELDAAEAELGKICKDLEAAIHAARVRQEEAACAEKNLQAMRGEQNEQEKQVQVGQEALNALRMAEDRAASEAKNGGSADEIRRALESASKQADGIGGLKRGLEEIRRLREKSDEEAGKSAENAACLEKILREREASLNEAEAAVGAAEKQRTEAETALNGAREAEAGARTAAAAAEERHRRAIDGRDAASALGILYPQLEETGICPLCGARHEGRELKEIVEKIRGIDTAKAVADAESAVLEARKLEHRAKEEAAEAERKLNEAVKILEARREGVRQAAAARDRATGERDNARILSADRARGFAEDISGREKALQDEGQKLGVTLAEGTEWSGCIDAAAAAAGKNLTAAQSAQRRLEALLEEHKAAQDRTRQGEKKLHDARTRLADLQNRISGAEADVGIKNKMAAEAKAEITGKESAANHLRQNAAQCRERMLAAAEEVRQADQRTAALKRERAAMLSGCSVKEAEDFLEKMMNSAEARLKEAQKAENDANLKLESSRSALKVMESQRAEAESAAAAKAGALAREIAESRFESADSAKAAVLTDAAREELLKEDQRLKEESARAAAAFEGARGDLERHGAVKLSMVPDQCPSEAFALEKQREAQEEIDRLHREIGAAGEKIHADDDARKRIGQRTAELNALQKEEQRWQNLCELIGDSSGDKFKSAAQKLTLDFLIQEANEILPGMTNGRYELSREEKYLAFRVIDHEMGDIQRPSASLSGGETFIVSLALALSLTKITAGHTRFDSLFLDEGFGTLDDKALSDVMAVLKKLRDSGKTIGIISHVDALVENRDLPTVEAKKRGNGRSTLAGAGVSHPE